MAKNIELGIKLNFDGKEVNGGLSISREQLRQFAADAKYAGEAASGGFTSAARGVRSMSEQLESLRSVAARGGAVIALALSAKRLGDEYIAAATASQRLVSSLEYSTGGARAAAREVDYLRSTARAMGLDFGTASDAYAKFAASARSAGISLEDTRKIFEGVSKAGARFGLSADEMSGAFLALGQMASKGVVSMEELRGQLGERLPGAFDLAAKAMGVTQAELIKLVESGRLAAADFLPAFARSLNENITAPTKNLQQDLNRLSSAWEDWKRSLADGAGGDSFAWLTRGLAESSAAMRMLGDDAGLVHKTLVAIGGFTFGAAANGAGADIAMAQEKARDRARELRAYIAPLQAQMDKISYLTPLQKESLRVAKIHLEEVNTELAKLAMRAGGEVGIKLPNLKEQVEKQRSAEDARLKGYGDDSQFAPKAAKIAADIEKENKAFNMAVVGLQETDQRYIKALKMHNERVAEIKAKGAEKATGGAGSDRARLVESLNGQIAAFEEQGDALKKLTANEAAYTKFKATSKLANDAEINALYKRAIALEKSGEATAIAKKEEEAYQRLKEQNIKALSDELKTIADQVDAQKKHNAEIGLTTEALAQLEQIRLDDAIATQEQAFAQAQKEGADLVELKLIDDKIAALRELKSLKAEGAARQVVADEAKRAADDWKKFTDDIERSLTDSLMRSFESSENFGKTFVKSLQNTLKTTVLKVAVQAVVGDVMGAVGMGGGSGGGGGSAGSMLSMGSNLSSLAGGGSSMYGAFATSGMGQALGLSQMSGGMSVAATKFAGMTVPAAEIAGTAELTSLGATLGSVAAAAPYILAAIAIADAVGAFGKRGGPQQGQYGRLDASGYKSSFTMSGGDALNNPQMASAAYAQAQALFAIAGKNVADLAIEQGYKLDPQGSSAGLAYRNLILGGKTLTGGTFDGNDGAQWRGGKDDAAGAAGYLAKITGAEIEALANAIDDSKLNAVIASLKANFSDLADGMQRYMTAQAVQKELLAAVMTSDEAEKRKLADANKLLADNFRQLGQDVPTTTAGFRALIDGLDLTTKAGQDTLMAMAGTKDAFLLVAEAAKKAEEQHREWSDKLAVMQGTTTEQRLAREKELASITDLSTLAIVKQVYALQDQAEATEKAAAAAQDQAEATEKAAAAAAKHASIVNNALDAYGGMLTATGDEKGALELAVSRANGAYDDAMRSLAEEIGVSTSRIGEYINEKGGVQAAVKAFWDEIGNSNLSNAEAIREKLTAFVSAYTGTINASKALSEYAPKVTEPVVAIVDDMLAKIAEMRAKWQDKLDVLTGATTQRAIELRDALASTTDAATLAIIRQVFALEDQKAANDRAAAAVSASLAAATQATDAVFSVLEKSVARQKESLRVTVDVAREQVNTFKSIVGTLGDGITRLRGQAMGAEMSGLAGQKFIDDALSSLLSTGYMPDEKALGEAMNAATAGIEDAQYSTAAEAALARAVLADKLEQMRNVGGRQLTAAEQQMALAESQLAALDASLAAQREQIDILRGTSVALSSIPTALASLASAIDAERAARLATSAAVNVTSGSTGSTGSTGTGSTGTGSTGSTGTGSTGSGSTGSGSVVPQLPTYTLISGGGQAWLEDNATHTRLPYTATSPLKQQELEDYYGISTSQITSVIRRAGGGFTPPGLTLVGEEGPELVNFKSPSMIYTAAQTKNLMGGGDTGLLAEIRALRAENALLRQEMTGRLTAIEQHTGKTSRAVNGLPDAPLLVEVAA